MREILFRGKQLDNGVWVYGNLFISETDNRTYILAESRRTMTKWEIDPSTVGQYTGLRDGGGRQIFEGDILELCMTGKVVVEFDDELFGANSDECGILPLRRSLFGEGGIVIGNIYDNR